MTYNLIGLFARRYRASLVLVAIASILLNVLLFAGTAYMMLVYDSVLPSRSVPTLAGLFGLLMVIYLFQALFETVRSEALLGIANGVHDDLFEAVHHATVAKPLLNGADSNATAGDGLQLTRDLDAIHGFLAGSGPVALIDLPWVLVFMGVLFALHWWLGLTALVGTVVLAALALWSNQRTLHATRELVTITNSRSNAALSELRFVEAARGLGMQERLIDRTHSWEDAFLRAQSSLARTVARLGGASRMVRTLLQSVILTVGALLVINNEATGGVILASSVLSGRAMAPVDMVIGNWKALLAARSGWARVIHGIAMTPSRPERGVELARPAHELAVRDLWVAPPGSLQYSAQSISFTLSAGQVLAVIGPSAAGKSSLVRALLGIWKPVRGEVRLDGATLDQWQPDTLGSYFGYVPQSVDLIDGTIAQNIARFDPDATSAGIIAAARAAGMHEAILAMSDGYETFVSAGGAELSAGQRQRIGLARALYGDPFLIVLDEANSNLDAAGDAALSQAVMAARQRGAIVIMITHRPSMLGPATHLAVMNGGRLADFGERDEILARLQGGDNAPPAARPRAEPAPSSAPAFHSVNNPPFGGTEAA